MGDIDMASQAKGLRDLATCLLQDAVSCIDPARRDILLNEALLRLNEAQLLLDKMEAATNNRRACHIAATPH